MKEAKEKYTKVLKELSQTCFTKEKLLKDLDAIEEATREPLARERKATAARREGGKGAFTGMIGPGPGLRVFVDKRTESVLAQLAGERKGYVAAGMGFGPPGGFQGPPGRFGPGNFLAKPLLEALNTNNDGKLSMDEVVIGAKAFFKKADKDNAGRLDAAQIAAGINAILPRPKGFPQPKTGFGMGDLMAGTIVKRATDKDGNVTLEKFVAAAEALFAEADRQKKGYLEESGVAAGLNLLFAPPQGFGSKLDAPK